MRMEKKKMTVSACMAFPDSIYNGKQITSEQSLSKYVFCYLGEERKSYNILLPDTYLQLLKTIIFNELLDKIW